MRTAPMFVCGLLLVAANAAMAASADYYLKIDAVGLDPGGPIYMKAHSSGDLDGDGRADNVVIRMECAAGVMHTAQYQVVSPRDAASGQAAQYLNVREGWHAQDNGGFTGGFTAKRSTRSTTSPRWSGASRMKAFSSRRLSIVSLDGAPSFFCSSATHVGFFISHLSEDYEWHTQLNVKAWPRRSIPQPGKPRALV